MVDRNRPLFADVKHEIESLSSDVRELLELRWKLARMELESDARTLAWLAGSGLVAAGGC
ncbi:MAG: hypothetical protein ABSG68_16810 [Thermoguttaceae bacterium]